MSTSHPVLNPTPPSAGLPPRTSHRGRWLIGVIAGAAAAGGVALLAGPSDSAPPPSNAAGNSGIAAAPAIAPKAAAPAVDHSVVESKSLLEEPDMTGASIGTYAP